MPVGWEKKIEENTGKIIFVDHQNQMTTYSDPRLAFAVEEAEQNVGEVRQRFDASSTALQVLHGRDLNGKLAIITGANTGIGFETARSLALHGCEVIMAGRNKKLTEEAIEKISLEKPLAGSKCRFVELDLASLRSVKEFIAQIKRDVK